MRFQRILSSAGRVRVPPRKFRLHLCARAHVSDRLELVCHAH